VTIIIIIIKFRPASDRRCRRAAEAWGHCHGQSLVPPPVSRSR
jgi:hypothetical protein